MNTGDGGGGGGGGDDDNVREEQFGREMTAAHEMPICGVLQKSRPE